VSYTDDLTWNVDFASCCQAAGRQNIADAAFIPITCAEPALAYAPTSIDLSDSATAESSHST